jgi:uncharacterized membrane protein
MTTASRSWQQKLAEQIVPDTIPRPRIVALDAPWSWLARGWQDMLRAPTVSLGYGVIFALGAAIIAYGFSTVQMHALFIAVAAAFLLVGPYFAVGLYECSRRLARGETASLSGLLQAGVIARGQLLFFGVMLLLVALLWMRVAMILMAVFLGTLTVPPPSEFLQLLLFTPQGLALLVVGSAVGAGFAVLVFAISAFAVPLLMVTKTDVISAARASMAAIVANPGAMALWAALIVVMMAAGFATVLVGLVVAFPLIGHATWHAYEDVYGAPATPQA